MAGWTSMRSGSPPSQIGKIIERPIITKEGYKIMSDKFSKSNQVTIRGEIVSMFSYSHEAYGKKFYRVDMKLKRLSGADDVIPVMVSDKLVDISRDYTGMFVTVNGQYRSCNRNDGQKSRLILSVYAQELEIIWEEPDAADSNHIALEGYLCKQPIHRKTPLGHWITDIILAVTRPSGGSDYIPCICWGRKAALTAGLEIGSHIKIAGRIQSRGYIKKLTETEYEQRTAYEVCVKKLDVSMDE